MIDFTACDEQYHEACRKYGLTPFDQDLHAPTVRRRWRVFLAVEGLLLTCWVVVFLFSRKLDLGPTLTALVGTWLAFTLPLAFLYVIGKPPLWTSACCRLRANGQ